MAGLAMEMAFRLQDLGPLRFSLLPAEPEHRPECPLLHLLSLPEAGPPGPPLLDQFMAYRTGNVLDTLSLRREFLQQPETALLRLEECLPPSSLDSPYLSCPHQL